MKEEKPKISLQLYLIILANSSMLVGVFLFLYAHLMSIPVMELQTMSNPLFYLVLGLGLYATWFFFRLDEVIDDAG